MHSDIVKYGLNPSRFLDSGCNPSNSKKSIYSKKVKFWRNPIYLALFNNTATIGNYSLIKPKSFNLSKFRLNLVYSELLMLQLAVLIIDRSIDLLDQNHLINESFYYLFK